MIKLISVLGLVFSLVMLCIIGLKSMDKLELLTLTKSVLFSVLVGLISSALIFVFVQLF